MEMDTAAALKTVLCPKCGKRMLIEVDEAPHEHRCPVCQAVFVASLRDGVLNVEFPDDP